MSIFRAFAVVLAFGAAAPALALDPTPAPEGARVFIVAPENGATVASPVTVVFGLAGMGVAPAGVEAPNTGHHHLIVNLDLSEIDMANPLPADESHLHYGGGQTQATLDLPPGEHRLFLLLGDHNHVPHDPAILSEVITITVE